ncbi:MAG: LPS export ABC transporter periplasmic protein LptC [Georgfuchsia sp.]
MRSFGSAAFPLTLVALLAALTFWLERAANPESPFRKALLRHDPDSIVSQIDIRHFDANGELEQAMLADTMTHYPDDDNTWIVKPQLTYFMGQRTTQLLANTAQISHDNKQIFLRGDVRLINPSTEDRPETVMQTEALTVFPDDNIAQGNLRTTISQGKSVVSGDSIHYDGNTNITILSGRVKGTFHRVKKS